MKIHAPMFFARGTVSIDIADYVNAPGILIGDDASDDASERISIHSEKWDADRLRRAVAAFNAEMLREPEQVEQQQAAE